ncbi:hypothetical protein AMECASPLE_026230 [Ameca splendens]|uniref:Uncharacterized protein n=1 Tax=Ameca splendens TaxID=208324 RepID=A0ABV0ZDR0_9TELE
MAVCLRPSVQFLRGPAWKRFCSMLAHQELEGKLKRRTVREKGDDVCMLMRKRMKQKERQREGGSEKKLKQER